MLFTYSSSILGLELLGAGATFPYPYYARLFSDYAKKTGIKINYQAIGSGGGIQQLKNKTVDFGASDTFLSNEELGQMPAETLHIPTCLGAVVLSYNLPGSPSLKLTPDVIADIFLGVITQWNDPRIQALNPKITLPAKKIMTVHRSDGSGTTAVFTSFLTKSNPNWAKKVGEGKSVKWPNGLGSKGNSGVAGMIKQLPGSVGYIELNYAKQNRMPMASVKNKAGQFIEPSLDSVSAAANEAMPNDTRINITNSGAKNAYPISTFTWLLVYKDLSGLPKDKAIAVKNLLTWIVRDGQKYASTLDYAPLSKSAQQKAEGVINSLTFKGSAL